MSCFREQVASWRILPGKRLVQKMGLLLTKYTRLTTTFRSRLHACTSSPTRLGFFHNVGYRLLACRRPIKMSPHCQSKVTHARVLGFREVRRVSVTPVY